MTTAEILNELPKLTIHERREIIKCLIELEEDQDILSFATHSTDSAFQILDEMEEYEQ